MVGRDGQVKPHVFLELVVLTEGINGIISVFHAAQPAPRQQRQRQRRQQPHSHMEHFPIQFFMKTSLITTYSLARTMLTTTLRRICTIRRELQFSAPKT